MEDSQQHNNTQRFGWGGKTPDPIPEVTDWQPCTSENPCLHALSGEKCLRCQLLLREQSGAKVTDVSGGYHR